MLSRFVLRRNCNWTWELSSILHWEYHSTQILQLCLRVWKKALSMPCTLWALLPEIQMQPRGGLGLRTLHFNKHPGHSVAEVPVSCFEKHSPGGILKSSFPFTCGRSCKYQTVRQTSRRKENNHRKHGLRFSLWPALGYFLNHITASFPHI